MKRRRVGGKTLARRKAKKLGRKWKAGGIPRTIVSADFQRRTQAVNFEYTQQWCVSPQIIGQTGGTANSLQFITFLMNDPTNIFGSQLPFGANTSQAVAAQPNYAREQRAYGDDGSSVNPQQVGNFAAWSKRYEKACVIGSKVTAVMRPKMVYRVGGTDAFETEVDTPQTYQKYPAQTDYEKALDASRIFTLVTDAVPFSTDPESINTTTKIPEVIQRAGVKSYRMSYTPGGKDGAFVTMGYSPKKFNHLKDLKDNQRFWSDIDLNTGRLKMTNQTAPGGTAETVKPIYGIIGIQKEELNSPTGVNAKGNKAQHDYYIECKYSCTVLFKDPYEVGGTNIPTAFGHAHRTGTQHVPHDMDL